MVLPGLDHLSIWMVSSMGNHCWFFGNRWKVHVKSIARCPGIRVVIKIKTLMSTYLVGIIPPHCTAIVTVIRHMNSSLKNYTVGR